MRTTRACRTSIGRGDRSSFWGGLDEDNALFLKPAFVVDAPPALPATGGEHRLVGRDADEAELVTLDDLPPGTRTRTDAIDLLSPGPGFEVRFSRGVPERDEWRGGWKCTADE